jgi:protein-S-isoprenylcysteine O-methyltransferase Ste14
VAQLFGSLAQRFGSLAQLFRGLAQVFGSVAQRFRSVAQLFRGPAQVFGSVAQRFRSLAQLFCSVAEVFCGPAEPFRGPAEPVFSDQGRLLPAVKKKRPARGRASRRAGQKRGSVGFPAMRRRQSSAWRAALGTRTPYTLDFRRSGWRQERQVSATMGEPDRREGAVEARRPRRRWVREIPIPRQQLMGSREAHSLRPRLFFSVIFKMRGLLMAPLVVLMAFSLTWECELDLLNVVIGVPVFVLGWGLRIWSQRHLKYRLLVSSPALATGGPYAYTRNPVYLGNLAILVGLSVLCELYWLVPITAAWALLVYHVAVVGFEEVRLRKMFGAQYEDYQSRVPRWLPRAAAVASLAPAHGTPLRRALRVEWQCAMLLLIPIVKELLIDGLLFHRHG